MRNRLINLIGDLAATDDRVIFMTGDLGFSVVEGLEASMGPRYINAGIAEANMTTMGGALAANGLIPYLYSIAPFVTMRCFEQVRNDICLGGRKARIIGIGTGFSYGQLGASHHALEDAHVIAALPNSMILAPGCFGELEQLFALTQDFPGLIYFRIGTARVDDLSPQLTAERMAWVAHPGSDVNLVVAGALLGPALTAAALAEKEHGLSINVVSCPLITPFPAQTVAALLCPGPVAVAWDAYSQNPLAVGVMETLLDDANGLGQRRFLSLHPPRQLPTTVGNQNHLLAGAGLDGAGLVRSIAAFVAKP